jgi:hypothetical protein
VLKVNFKAKPFNAFSPDPKKHTIPPSAIGRSVKCAENRDVTSEECVDLKVCVTNGTTQSNLLSNWFDPDRLNRTTGDLEAVESFANGICQVFASGENERTDKAIKTFYPGEYDIGSVSLSRESLCLVTNEDDAVFSKLVDTVVNAILYADEQGITQESNEDMPRCKIFYPLISNDSMLRYVIAAVGSSQEIWDRHARPLGLSRKGRNAINKAPYQPMLTTVHTWDKPPPTMVRG